MHHSWQTEFPASQSKSLRSTTVGAGSFGRFEDLALLHPEDPEREARDHGARYEDEVNHWDGKGNQGSDETRANDAR
jgi:hypothetical protein